MHRTQSIGAEKRKSPRIDLYTPVWMKHEAMHKVKDLSLNGLFIRTSQFMPGDRIQLVMKLPEEMKSVRLEARITRVTTEGIGVEFVDAPPQDRMSLESCFDVFKHTVPIPDSWETSLR
jgi:hypothetical protein